MKCGEGEPLQWGLGCRGTAACSVTGPWRILTSRCLRCEWVLCGAPGTSVGIGPGCRCSLAAAPAAVLHICGALWALWCWPLASQLPRPGTCTSPSPACLQECLREARRVEAITGVVDDQQSWLVPTRQVGWWVGRLRGGGGGHTVGASSGGGSARTTLRQREPVQQGPVGSSSPRQFPCSTPTSACSWRSAAATWTSPICSPSTSPPPSGTLGSPWERATT